MGYTIKLQLINFCCIYRFTMLVFMLFRQFGVFSKKNAHLRWSILGIFRNFKKKSLKNIKKTKKVYIFWCFSIKKWIPHTKMYFRAYFCYLLKNFKEIIQNWVEVGVNIKKIANYIYICFFGVKNSNFFKFKWP